MQQDSVAQAASGLRGSEERVRAGLSFMEREHRGERVSDAFCLKKSRSGSDAADSDRVINAAE